MICDDCVNLDLDKIEYRCTLLYPTIHRSLDGETCTKYRRYRPMTPYDKAFEVDGHEQLCHATGYEVMIDGELWNEYEDSEGGLHYGR